MPQPLQFIWDLLREGTPLWLFGLAAILYFSIGPFREIASERRARRDQAIASENECKENIVALIESAWVIKAQIDDRLGWIDNEYLMNQDMFPNPDPEGHDHYVSDMKRISQALQEIYVHDGSHENLLETKLLLNEMKDVQRQVESEATHVQRIANLSGSI